MKDILSVDDSIQYTGVDFSELMIEEAKEINSEWLKKKRAEFFLANVEKLPFKDKSFTKIYTINTLYFWSDPKNVLKEIKRVLKPVENLYLSFVLKNLYRNYLLQKLVLKCTNQQKRQSYNLKMILQ